jgi:hypothetical protein
MALACARWHGRALLCKVACRFSTYRTSRAPASRGAVTAPRAQSGDLVDVDGTQVRPLPRPVLSEHTLHPRPAPHPLAPPAGCSPHLAQRFTLRVPLGSDGESAKALPRLDAFVSAALPRGASRARVTAAIKAGALTINGRVVTKPSSQVRMSSENELLSGLLF